MTRYIDYYTYKTLTKEQYLEELNKEMMGRVYLRTKQLQEAIKSCTTIYTCMGQNVPSCKEVTEESIAGKNSQNTRITLNSLRKSKLKSSLKTPD